MQYNKPELVAMANAVKAIQNQNKDCQPQTDGATFVDTIGAYQADE
jgi:hypothetical protein